MPRPTVKLTLVEFDGPDSSRRDFEVVKAENTVRYRIGSMLTKREVEALHASGVRTTLIRRKT